VSVATPEGSSVVSLRRPCSSFVLTYDDGPTPGVTDRLLPVLAEAGATATFFVLLTRARRNPSLLREVVTAGHEVGLHGLDHRSLPGLPDAVHEARFRDGRAELEQLAGVPVRWSRPPYGAQNVAAWRAARAAGLTPVLWSAHCRDWEDLPQDDYVAEARAIEPEGCVLLLHDGFADRRDEVDDGPEPSRLDRVALTGAVLDRVGEAGLTVSSLGRALARADAVQRPWLHELGEPS
jgi:peptidoglycan/xylan/chitin deacetylase (PgdA/CDA1 family)